MEMSWVWMLRVEADIGYIILQNKVDSGSVNMGTPTLEKEWAKDSL